MFFSETASFRKSEELIRKTVATELNYKSCSTICKRLLLQPIKESVDDRLAVLFVNCAGEGNAHRAGLDAVLRVAAAFNAAFTHDSLEALVARGFAAGMHVE